MKTFFDSEQPSGSFAGLDLGEPQTISEIRYLPRNEGENQLIDNLRSSIKSALSAC